MILRVWLFSCVLIVGCAALYPGVAQAGWLSSWWGGSTSPGSSTSTSDGSSNFLTVQPVSPPASYGGPRVVTVSPKNAGRDITDADRAAMARQIQRQNQFQANLMETILKNKSVADTAIKRAEAEDRARRAADQASSKTGGTISSLPPKTNSGTAPGGEGSSAPMVARPVTPLLAVPNAPLAPIAPILPKGIGTQKAPANASGSSGSSAPAIQPILPHLPKK